jgi:phosphate transport system permease protein
VQIFGNANSSFAAAQERAWAAALTLVLLTFIVTLVARLFTARLALKR